MSEFIRGTTPTHIFEIPFDSDIVKSMNITYCQHKEIILEKDLSDCILDGNSISVTLSQDDTLKFSHRRPVEIQIKILTNSGKVLATSVTDIKVGRVLSEEVLQ